MIFLVKNPVIYLVKSPVMIYLVKIYPVTVMIYLVKMSGEE